MGFASLLAVLLVLPTTCSYPDYFVQNRDGNVCLEHPNKEFGMHGAPTKDKETTIILSPTLSGASPSGQLCPGAMYSVKVSFPGPRLALLTASSGTLTGADATCPNRIVTPAQVPVASWTNTLKVACNTAGKKLQIKVTSAQSSTGAFNFASVTVPVAGTTGPCMEVSSHCGLTGPSSAGDVDAATIVPTSKFDPNSPGAAVAGIDGIADDPTGPRLLQPPVYSLRPVLKRNRVMWQFLHSVLMLAAFGLLFPMGVLLARHKYMFGSSEGRVSTSWFWVHLFTQVLALLVAVAGFVMTILAFGWKDVPGLKLYLPHKWMGVGVMGMVLLQLLASLLRPAKGSACRSCWKLLHFSWGRLVVLAGAANTILGALLVHDYKAEPYQHWLLPCCVLLGAVGLLALCLEAFKLQMQRTYRYNARTGAMMPVLQGYKHSRRRGHAGQQEHYGSSSSTDTEAAAAAGAAGSTLYPTVQYEADTAPVHDQGVMLNGQHARD